MIPFDFPRGQCSCPKGCDNLPDEYVDIGLLVNDLVDEVVRTGKRLGINDVLTDACGQTVRIHCHIDPAAPGETMERLD